MDLTGIGAVANLINSAVTRIWPDATEAEKAKLELLKLELTAVWENAKAQLEVNAAEAQNQSIFVAGWRPFVGWVCGIAFAYQFIVLPIVLLVCSIMGKSVPLPAFDFTTMLNVLLGMLGLGAMRSYEKTKGISIKG